MPSQFRDIGPYLNLGFQFAIAVCLGVALGYWLDMRFNTMLLFTILGLLLGGALGFTSLYRSVYSGRDKKKNGK
jgi:ATP synthase protein I